MNTVANLIIIGSGPAGLTAAIYAARANLSPILIEGKTPGGQLMGTTAVENWPGEESILGPQLMINMQNQAKKLGTTFIAGDVVALDATKRPFTVTTDKGETLQAHAVIIASGATPRRIGCPGEDTYWGKGVTTCAVCDGAFYKNQPVIIVGGGDTAMEDASFMTNYTDSITIVHIKDALTASHAMQQRVLNNPKIKIIYESTVTQIQGDDKHVTGAIITNLKTKEQQTLKTNAIFVAVGLKPNTDFIKGSLELLPGGYLKLTDETKTSVDGIFGAGDVHDFKYRQACVAAAAGCSAALDAERWLKTMAL